MVSSKIIMITLVWFFCFISFLRTWRRNIHTDNQVSILRWLILLFAISFSFWGPESELLLDQHLNYYPVALFVKLITLVTVTYLFHQMLKIIHNTSSPLKYLDYFAFIVFPLAILIFLLYIATGFVSYEQLRYLVIGIRDLIIIIYMFSHFLRKTWCIWKKDSSQVIKIKGLFIFICFSCFCITAIGSISAAALAFVNLNYAYLTSIILEPFIYLGALFFILQLLPDSFLLIFFIIKRWHTYKKIRQLEAYIISDQALRSVSNCQLTDYSFLEVEIYRSVIHILDHIIHNEDDQIALKIQTILSQNPSYAELIKYMTRIKV